MINFPPNVKATRCKTESHTLPVTTKHGMQKIVITLPVQSRSKPAQTKGRRTRRVD